MAALLRQWDITDFFVEPIAESQAKNRRIILICLCLCVYSLVFTNRFVYEGSPINNQELSNNEYVDRRYLKTNSTIPNRQDFVSNNKTFEYSDFARNYDSISFSYSINGGEGSYVDVPLTYYPGYAAFVDGNKTEISCGRTGVVRVSLPDGINEGVVDVKYTEKPLWVIADLISLCSSVVFVFLLGKRFIQKLFG